MQYFSEYILCFFFFFIFAIKSRNIDIIIAIILFCVYNTINEKNCNKTCLLDSVADYKYQHLIKWQLYLTNIYDQTLDN